MSVDIIINPRSGGGPPRGRQRAEQASNILSSLGADGDVFVTERRGHAVELARASIRRGSRLVIAWGGDGTVNEVASALLGAPNVALGIVPSGSGNGLARELGISRDPDRAIREAIGGSPRTVDTGEIAGRPFVSIAGVGFDAHVAACFDRDPTGRRGLAGYIRTSARELRRYQRCDYAIDGVPACGVMILTIANSAQFGNGARIAPHARVDDGLLDLVIFEERSRLATLAALPRLFWGGLDRVKGVTMKPIERVAIDCARPMICHADGEPFEAGTHVEAVVRPRSLRVAVR